MVWDRPRIDPVFWDRAKDLTGLHVIVEDLYGSVRRGVLRPADPRSCRHGFGITSNCALVWDGGNCYETYRKIDRRIVRLTVDDGRPALPECPGWYTPRNHSVVYRFDGRYWSYAGNKDGSNDPTVSDAPLTPAEFVRMHPDCEDGGLIAVTFKDRLASPCGNDPRMWETPRKTPGKETH